MFNYEYGFEDYYQSINQLCKNSKIKDHYGKKKIITSTQINKAVNNYGHVMIASSVLIKPSKKLFKNYLRPKNVDKNRKLNEIKRKIFGSFWCFDKIRLSI